MYGLVITSTGWTVQQLDATPWPNVLELLEYWGEWKPSHILLRWFIAPGESKGKPANEDELAQVVAEFTK